MKDEFLELLVKAIDDALNHAHYSLMHPDTEPPMEHNEWKHQWLLKNVPLYKQKLTKHGVMQPASASAQGAAVGNSAAGQSGSVDLCKHEQAIYHKGYICKECNKAL